MQHKDQCPIKCGQKNSTGMSMRCVLRKLRIFEIKCRLPTGSGERLHRICAATTTSGKFVRVIFILLSLHNQIRNRNRLEWFKSPTTRRLGALVAPGWVCRASRSIACIGAMVGHVAAMFWAARLALTWLPTGASQSGRGTAGWGAARVAML